MPKPTTEVEWCEWLAKVVFARLHPFTHYPEYGEPVPFDPFHFDAACRWLEEKTMKEGWLLSSSWYTDVYPDLYCYEVLVRNATRRALLGKSYDRSLTVARARAMCEAWWAMKGETDADTETDS